MNNKIKTIYNLLLSLQSKYKYYLLTEFKSYISVFLYIIIIFSVFADNMAFSAGPSCVEDENYNAYDRCRDNITDIDKILLEYEKDKFKNYDDYRKDEEPDNNNSAKEKEKELQARNENAQNNCRKALEKGHFTKLNKCNSVLKEKAMEYLDVEGNIPVNCLPPDIGSYNTDTDGKEYFYDTNNANCLYIGLSLNLTYSIEEEVFDALCEKITNVVAYPDPQAVQDKIKKAKGIKKIISKIKKGMKTIKDLLSTPGMILQSATSVVGSTVIGMAMDPHILLIKIGIHTATEYIPNAILSGKHLSTCAAASMVPPGCIPNNKNFASCLLASTVPIATVGGAMGATLGGQFENMKNAISKIAVCGDDWYSYAYTGSMLEEPIHEWHPDFGSFSNSYSYKITKIMNKQYSCDDFYDRQYKNSKGKLDKKDFDCDSECKEEFQECIATHRDSATGDANIDYCESKTSKSCSSKCLKYISRCEPIVDDILEDGDGICKETDNISCKNITPFSKDMRNRVFRELQYDGKEFKIDIDDPNFSYKCFDPRIPEIRGYDGKEQRYYFRGYESANYACERFKYKGQGCMTSKGKIVTFKDIIDNPNLETECREVFDKAYECCMNRAARAICIYERKVDTDNRGVAVYKHNRNNNTICLTSENNIYTCTLSDIGGTVGPIFKALTSEGNGRDICIRNDNYCPYQYNIGGGTILEKLYSDGDYTNISKPDYYKVYKQSLMSDKQPELRPTVAYGKTKNFCFFNKHCTKPGIGDNNNNFANMTGNKFMPAVCSNFVGDSQYLPVSMLDVDLSVAGSLQQLLSAGGEEIGDLKSMSQVDALRVIRKGIRSLNEYQLTELIQFLIEAKTMAILGVNATLNFFMEPQHSQIWNALLTGTILLGDMLEMLTKTAPSGVYMQILMTISYILLQNNTYASKVSELLSAGGYKITEKTIKSKTQKKALKVINEALDTLTQVQIGNIVSYVSKPEVVLYLEDNKEFFEILDNLQKERDSRPNVMEGAQDFFIGLGGAFKDFFIKGEVSSKEDYVDTSTYKSRWENYFTGKISPYDVAYMIYNDSDYDESDVGKTIVDTLAGAIYSFINQTDIIEGVDFSLGSYRGFTAPIAQCIKETINNMFMNRAATSLCTSATETVNEEGLCGSDTFGPPIRIRSEKYDRMYSDRLDAYHYVIGDQLPENYNIFKKIQNRLRLIIKLAAIVALTFIALQFLIGGKLDIFDGQKSTKGLINGMLKFAIVFYFAIGDAWQGTFYEWIDKGTTSLYNMAFNLSLIGYNGYRVSDASYRCKYREMVEFTRYQTVPKEQCSSFLFDENNTDILYFTIPNNVNKLRIHVWGADGGNGYASKGGKGGYSYGEIDVVNTDKISVSVGGAGKKGKNGYNSINETIDQHCGGAGGYSVVKLNNIPLIIAGGGGGGSCYDRVDGKDGYGGYNNSTSFQYYGMSGNQNTGGEGGISYIDHTRVLNYFGIRGSNTYIDGRVNICYDTMATEGVKEQTDTGYINKQFNNLNDLPTVIPIGNMAEVSLPSVTLDSHNNKITTTRYFSQCTEVPAIDDEGNPIYKYSDRYDGCYFGDAIYPEGKQYLSIFDSLDCKLSNVLGYGMDTSLPGILHFMMISLFLPGLGPLIGLTTVILTAIFFVTFLFIVLKALYIFLMSIIAVNIMIFVTPIIFPMLLHSRTKSIFDNWLKEFICFCLQYILVAVYIGFLIGTYERYTIGSAFYTNHEETTGRFPILNCPSEASDSLVCIFQINPHKGTDPAWGILTQVFGIGPYVTSVKSIIQDFSGTLLTIFEAVMITFLLLIFIEKIPTVASKLLNGTALNGVNTSPSDIIDTINKVKDKAQAAQRLFRRRKEPITSANRNNKPLIPMAGDKGVKGDNQDSDKGLKLSSSDKGLKLSLYNKEESNLISSNDSSNLIDTQSDNLGNSSKKVLDDSFTSSSMIQSDDSSNLIDTQSDNLGNSSKKVLDDSFTSSSMISSNSSRSTTFKPLLPSPQAFTKQDAKSIANKTVDKLIDQEYYKGDNRKLHTKKIIDLRSMAKKGNIEAGLALAEHYTDHYKKYNMMSSIEKLKEDNVYIKAMENVNYRRELEKSERNDFHVVDNRQIYDKTDIYEYKKEK